MLKFVKTIYFNKGPELRVTVLHIHLLGAFVKRDYRLIPRDTDIGYCYVVGYSSTHVIGSFVREVDDVNGFR